MFFYIIQFLIFLCFISLTVLLYLTLKNKKNIGMKGIVFIILASYFWLIGSYFEIISTDPDAMLFWRDFTQIGVCFLPVAMIYFSTEFSSASNRTRTVWVGVIFMIATAAAVLLWTDRHHHLMRISTDVIENRLGTIIRVRSTTFGLILMSYVSASHLISEAFLVLFLRTAVPRVRKQLYLLVAGLSFPVVFIMVKSFFPSDLLSNIPTPVAFIPMSFLIGIAMFRFDSNSFSPVILTEIFNAIDEIIIITDPDASVIDLNKRAEDLFSLFSSEKQPESGNRNYGDLIRNISSDWYNALLKNNKEQTEFSLSSAGTELYYNVSVHPLFNHGEKFIGCISVLRDVSEDWTIKKNLISRAETDGLTGCLNKSAFEKRAGDILSNQAARGAYTAFIMFDLDFFKSVNDNYGHDAGDRLLKAVTLHIRNVITPEDLFGRLGGEEFGVLISDMNREVVSGIAERIRRAVQSVRILSDDQSVSVTASIGCSIIEHSTFLGNPSVAAADMIKRSDRALYHAKNSGRNRVCWDDDQDDY